MTAIENLREEIKKQKKVLDDRLEWSLTLRQKHQLDTYDYILNKLIPRSIKKAKEAQFKRFKKARQKWLSTFICSLKTGESK